MVFWVTLTNKNLNLNILTREFLEKQKVDVESVLDWIINEGGGCDCEVLYNVEECFEEYR